MLICGRLSHPREVRDLSTTHFGHVLATEGALVLAAEDPHPSAAFEADGVVTGTDRVDAHVTKANATRILGGCIPAFRRIGSGG